MKRYLAPTIIILMVVLADQFFKFYIKQNFQLYEDLSVFGNWFKLYFVENEGMAFGLSFGAETGKYILTFLRIVLVFGGFWYLYKTIKEQKHWGFIICVSLIIAGAIGNIIDSVFYGIWFQDINTYSGGYFQGHVVDMLYFPMVSGHFPEWFPIWSKEPFTFFSPIFNLADASISCGVIAIVIFQKVFFIEKKSEENIISESDNLVDNEGGLENLKPE